MRELVAVEAEATDPDLGDEINNGGGGNEIDDEEDGDGDEWRYEIAQYAVVFVDTNGPDFIILPRSRSMFKSHREYE
ncbi:hypothetical protein TorRG33x02_324150 [Trema orientale]|uniref:Uncharacterized protein n=1 Tax=Trema orientale TaxID=63057 RepID=A0A2P5BEA1_TREOI|nr:hypothetical protein TorRG33x02_324150 [Trema orientale]